MKCIQCAAIEMNTETDFVYRGYSLCEYHAHLFAKHILENQEEQEKRKYLNRFYL